MLNIKNIGYRVVVLTEDGKRYNISKLVQNLGWEEPESELAVRTTFSFRNKKTKFGKLSSILKPGVLVMIYAVNNGKKKEVARGYVVEWNPKKTAGANDLSITAYDELYNLQKSQDNVFFAKGTGTESAIRQLLGAWGVQIGTYNGPNVTHGKMAYKGKNISDMLLDILEDARKKGGKKCIIRASNGKANILRRCSNDTVYCFTGKNTETVSYKKSTADMVTKVKVYGKEDDDGHASVEAVVEGNTKFGVRQKIQSKGEEETLEEAKKAAQEILDEDGGTEKDINVETPDVPYVRKGDVVYMKVGFLKGYYEVLSVRHDADSKTMTMGLKKTAAPSSSGTDSSDSSSGADGKFNVGDIVMYQGGTHYVSSYDGAAGYPATAGKAKITAKDEAGKAHQWHLIHADGSSNVYGWVDNGTFEEVN